MALPRNGRRRGWPLADDVGRTGGSSTGECRCTGTVEVTATSPPETPMRSLEHQFLFPRHGGVVEYAAMRTG